MKFTSLLEYVNDHKDRTDTIAGWSVVKTKHGVDREHERHGGELPGGHHEFMHKVIKKISGVKNPRSGEFMYHSKKHDQAAVLNVDHEKKQLRVITVLPKGRSIPKHGTQKFMIEGVEQEIKCIVLHDTEFDEAMDRFVTEEFGVGLEEVLAESNKDELLENSDIESEFVTKYSSRDPLEVFRSVKGSFMHHTSNHKAVDLGAANLSKKHATMSRSEFDKHVIDTVFPHIKKAGYPHPDSKAFHDSIYNASKEAFKSHKSINESDDLYSRSSKEHHEKFAMSHEVSMKKATDPETKSLHTRGMNLHLKAAAANNSAMSKSANDFSKSLKNGTAGVPGMNNVPKHIKDDEQNRKYSSPGPKFRK